jgi:SAM-dependent methyltransferase
MHHEARHFMKYVTETFPDSFKRKRVLDVGSGDINGNNRWMFTECEYHGNDVAQAPNVTIVSKTKDLPFDDESFDTIVSTECFEHDPEYEDSLKKMYRMLKPGGLMAFTCASTGRPEHGTRRTSPGDSYGTKYQVEGMVDYYKNLTQDDIRQVFDIEKDFDMCRMYYNERSHDLYMIGRKRGIETRDIANGYTANGVTCVFKHN